MYSECVFYIVVCAAFFFVVSVLYKAWSSGGQWRLPEKCGFPCVLWCRLQLSKCREQRIVGTADILSVGSKTCKYKYKASESQFIFAAVCISDLREWLFICIYRKKGHECLWMKKCLYGKCRKPVRMEESCVRKPRWQCVRKEESSSRKREFRAYHMGNIDGADGRGCAGTVILVKQWYSWIFEQSGRFRYTCGYISRKRSFSGERPGQRWQKSLTEGKWFWKWIMM